MPYLTEQEYKNMGFADIAEPFNFDNLLTKASMMLDVLTLNFYKKHDLSEDKSFRAERFKMAVATQINHYIEVDATTTSELEDFESVTIGRTSVKYANKSKGKLNALQSDDVMTLLSTTGLLNRGVC